MANGTFRRLHAEWFSPLEALGRSRSREGRHDGALVARVPALFWIEKHGWRNLEIGGQPVLSPEYAYAVPDGNEGLLSAFSEGLAAIKSTGEYRAIQTRWLGPYEQPRIGAWAIARYALVGAVLVIALLVGALIWSRSLQRLVRQRTADLQRETQALRESEERLAEARPPGTGGDCDGAEVPPRRRALRHRPAGDGWLRRGPRLSSRRRAEGCLPRRRERLCQPRGSRARVEAGFQHHLAKPASLEKLERLLAESPRLPGTVDPLAVDGS